ncbi:MAG: calcium-binding protein [Methylococcales bacterium]|nr:calcium-binding protein [Methylococcales bacterium]
MTTVTGTSTSLDESFILTSTGDYRGGQGADTYILTNQIPASAIITITDKEGLNKIQLADGLVIASSKFLSNAAELTLSNGAIVRILGASSFTFDIGANTTTGDIATNPNSTYADFAKALGAQVGSTTGTPNFLVPVTIPTFSIVAGDTFSTIAAGNVSGFSASGVSEGSNATFTVKLSAAQTAAATVNYSLSGKGTTTIGNDTGTVAVQGTGVTATGGTLTFAAGITTATISVPVTFDTLLESGEGIDLTLSSPSSGVLLGTDFIASKDFLDSTAPTFSMSSSAVSGIHTLEGSTITFTITPDAVLTRDITLRLDLVGAVKNGTVPADFQIAAPELIFNTGNSLLKTITVNVANDISMEGVENYTAVLVDTKTGIQKAPSIIGTINDSANVTGPVFIGAEMDTAGTSIDLIYNQALGKAATETTSPFAFVIKVGTNIVTPSSVTVVGSRVKLNLADAITKGINDVTIDYISPTASALTSNPAIQDILGNDAFPIVKFPVKNNSILDSLASTLTLAMESNFNGPSTASTVSLKANSPISTIFNATSAPGIKQIIIDGTKAEVTVNNLATLATVQLNNQPFGNLSVAYALTSPVVTSTSTSDVQRLTVSNVGSTDSVAVAIDKVESLILVSTNYPNKVGLSGVTAATTIAVEGDKALTITTVPLLLNNFNAASATASINANLSAATKLLSVQGGAGADTITVDATKLDPNALISGNGSADTLFINSGATATPLQPRMSTVETLKIGAITGDLVFKGDKTTDLTNLSLASTLGANVNLENLTTSNFTVDTNGVTAAKTVTVTNIGTETLNYIAESTSFDNNDAIFNFSNASALTVNVGKNVVQKGAITANKAVSITLSVTSSKTSENPTELTSFKGSLNSLTASSLNVNATGTLVPGSETLDLTTSALPKLKTLTITGGGSVSMKAAQYNLLETITAAGTDTIILSDIGDVTAKAGIEKYDLGSIGSIGRKITIPSEVVAAVTIKGGTGADTITLGALGATITVDDSTVAVTGGAGADNVTFLNTLALADTLSFDGGIGTDSVVLPAFANTITLTNVETITATAGLTAQTITVAGTSAVALAAGAGVQNILSTNTALTTITDAATTTSIVTGIATGTGGYSINTGVLNSAINFSAMTGIAPMTIALNAGGPTAVTITEATATNTGTTTLTVGATTQTVTVTGGATAHTFTSTALSNINYTAVTAVTAQAITTGAGNDIIAGGGGADSITVGNGTNSVIVANKADLALLVTLVGGTGTDTLTITAPTTPIVDTDFSKTAAFDTLVLGAATIATFDTSFKSAGFTSITGSGGIDALTFAGVAPLVSINGGVGADTITVTSTLGSTLTIADTDGISVTGGTGIDAITFSVAPIATTVTGGLGADTIALGALGATITVDDSTMIVTGGAKDDNVTFLNTAAVAAGGAGSLAFDGAAGTDTVTLPAFNSHLTVTNVETVNATAALTGNTIIIAGTSPVAVTAGAGVQNITNTTTTGTGIVTITDSATTTSIVTGAATGTGGYSITAGVLNAAINFSAMTGIAPMTIALNAAGPNAVTITEATATNTGTTTLTGGAITQTVTVTGGATAHTFTSTALSKINYTGGSTVQTITTGALADTITGGGGSDVINAGAGDDRIVVADHAALLQIAGGTGLIGGAGTDTLVVTAATGIVAGDFANITLMETLVLGAGGSETIDGGFTTAGFTSITGSAGDDLITFTTIQSNLTITSGGGADVITLGNFANKLTFNGVAGVSDTITGGTGADTIIGGDGIDKIVAGTGYDSMTGGAGADVFGFAGATSAGNDAAIGGFDTITDFLVGTDKLQFNAVTDAVSANQAGVQTAVTALAAGSTAAQIVTAMSNASATNLGVSFATFGGDTYVLYETTGSGTTFVVADDIFIKLSGVTTIPVFANDVIA